MDVILATHTDNPFLAMTNIERYADASGYGCNLTVRSAWLSAVYPFHFEPYPLAEFIAALRELDRTLKGQATLKPMWEDHYLRFEGDGIGRVRVSGLLFDCGGNDQQVRFSFEVDQTCLARFVADLTSASLP
ncbi:WapI family immunity protein [Caulobacter vibrioides]|uniref:WapI family immunity protein n=1 Tax=Caulobacter vibrioides TaxID=155892 RepID=UPI000BB4A8BB|nr:hypothetical protein [Caulobacter vibrioides]ATC23366.1 hypothetical protein CA608_01860 [Caulobacter vibrioides]PLR11363.1 hypothetical protein CVUC_11750 [Caulobacter vibrioides]